MDENQILFLSVFILFMLALIVVGILVSRTVKSGEDFLMGGRGLSPFLLIGTTMATLVGTGSSMGAVQFAFTNGWGGVLYGIGSALGVFFLIILFADVRKYNFMTFSEELSFYYGANKFVKGLTSILLFAASIGWLGAHIMGGGLYLAWVTGLDPTISRIIVGLGFAIFTIIGGYMAVVITDTILGIILFFGFILLTVLSLVEVGGFSGLSSNLPNDMTSFLGIDHMGLIPAISLALVTGVGVLATPSYRHRIYSSKDVSTVKKSFFITGILIAIFSVFPAIAGMSARVLNPEINDGFAFPYLATDVFPLLIGVIILISGLSATVSSGSSDYITGVTILLRDVYQLFTGKVPKKENMVLNSRVALILVLLLAFVITLGASNIIDYISNFISTVMSGLFIAALLGKFWPRATWQGGLASLIGGSVTSLIVLMNESFSAFWGNPIIPSLLVALILGVVISLITPKNVVSNEEALKILGKERAIMDEGTVENSLNPNKKED